MGFRLFPDNLKQWKVVVVAFATATTFWFFNSLNQNYTTNLNYPINFSFNRDSLISVRKLPSSIELDVSGGGWSLLKKTAVFSPEPLTIEMANAVGKASLNWLELLPEIREQIKDLNVNQVLGDTLRIQIEPIVSKWVRPEIDSVSISFEENFRIISPISIQEDSILIKGPKSYIDTLGAKFRIKIREEDIDGHFDDNVSILNPDQSLVVSDPENINASFQVDQFLKLRIEVPVEAINFPADSSLVLLETQVVIEFVMQESLEKEYEPQHFGLIADFEKFQSSDSTLQVELTSSPDEISDIKLLPEILKVVPND